jgi:transcriptional regulator with XRE-family HTH domain
MSTTSMSAADDPGDLSRRVAARRRALGLGLDQVAGRAGMDPGYLAHIEHHAEARPSPAACARLAAALQTSVAWLRGAGVDLPPGHVSPPASTPVLHDLEPSESLELLEPGGVGRVVFVEGERAVALPVNFVMLGSQAVFRTGEGTIADAVRSGRPMSLEVDHLDEALGEGWSVLLSGVPEVVSDPDDLARIEALHVEPWAGGDRQLVVRLDPHELTGRRIRRWHEAGA